MFSLPGKKALPHEPPPASGPPALPPLGSRPPTFSCQGVACSGRPLGVESWGAVRPVVPDSLTQRDVFRVHLYHTTSQDFASLL